MTEKPDRIELDSIVVNPRAPSWGPGRVMSVDADKMRVYFRDIAGDDDASALKTMKRDVLVLAPTQTDPWLDHLPPLRHGVLDSKERRVTFERGLEQFRMHYPLLFDDPKYFNDERTYKFDAHRSWIELLGDGKGDALIEAERWDELRENVVTLIRSTNLLFKIEKTALREGLEGTSDPGRFYRALFSLTSRDEPAESVVQSYFDVVTDLPTRGAMNTAKWPIATLLPFLARPDVYMFLKPDVTKACSARLRFDLGYRPEPNWNTYARLMAMSQLLMERLAPLGARDWIDVQSFIWVVGYVGSSK